MFRALRSTSILNPRVLLHHAPLWSSGRCHGVSLMPAAPLQHRPVRAAASCRERHRCALSGRSLPRSGSLAHRPCQHKPVTAAAVSSPPLRLRQAPAHHLPLSSTGSPAFARELVRTTNQGGAYMAQRSANGLTVPSFIPRYRVCIVPEDRHTGPEIRIHNSASAATALRPDAAAR